MRYRAWLSRSLQLTGADAPCSHCFVTPQLASLRGLTALRVSYSFWSTDYDPYGGRPGIPQIVSELVERNSPSLRDVELHGDADWSAPTPRISSLTVVDAHHVDALPAIITTNNLVRLKLCVMGGAIDVALLAMAAAPTACPLLEELKLVGDISPTVDCDSLRHVGAFLRNKSRLRMLHVVFYSARTMNQAPLLDAIRALPSIEVLGFELSRSRFDRTDMLYLQDVVPVGLRALLLYTNICDIDVSMPEVIDVVRTSVRYC